MEIRDHSVKKGRVVNESPKAHVPFSETEQEENVHVSMGVTVPEAGLA